MTVDQVSSEFLHRFGHQPDFVVRAPGRVNLIGDHTDYTGGLVLPIAIDRSVVIAARRIDEPRAHVYSQHFDQAVTIALGDTEPPTKPSWSDYVVGVIALLKRREVDIGGVEMLIGGDLPPGAGLASSAALEVGVATALLYAADRRLSPVSLATLCRQAEHEFADSPCGIMDQLCCTSARSGHAMLIDCRRMVTEHVPLTLRGTEFVVIDTDVRHAIAGGEYAQRRRECAAALGAIMNAEPSVTSLQDVTERRLGEFVDYLDETLLRRTRHVASENARVERAVEALKANDLRTFGRLMNESHRSLDQDFEVSANELNDVCAIAQEIDGVYGARMTGGGFGGCVIALASKDAIPRLEAAIAKQYNARHDTDASVFVVRAADGVNVVDHG